VTAPTVVYLVPHTHWDREWYLPFQSFRLRLVGLVDRVLDALEADPRFVFTLDGQLATIDDYLELRPEAEERIRALVGAGRLALGPWQILMDEFLVSAETIVRNLELGRRRAEELGAEPMPVGYLPDMFGHVAQMPQLLRRAGIEQAVVWRGVPAAIDRHVFTWTAPDGSSVRAEYLPDGYGNAAHVADPPGRLAAKLERLAEEARPFFGDDPVLALYGTDHTEPLPEIAELVERANAAGGSVRVELATLPGYFGRVPGPDPVPEWRGELRSAARANLLPGVTSARIDLKAACARAERLLARYAEPLQALWGEGWPEAALGLAWRGVIENSAHDSICGCSVDAVSRQVLVRFEEAEQIAGALAAEAAEAVAGRVARGSAAVLNPSPHPRTDVVELELSVPDDAGDVALALPDGSLLATQEVSRTEPLLLARDFPASEIPAFLDRRLHGRELLGRLLSGLTIDEADGRPRVTLDVAAEPGPELLDVDELRAALALATEAAPDETWLLRVLERPRRRLLAAVPAPALGWTAVRPATGRGRVEGAVRGGEGRLENGRLELEVAEDGTLRLGGLTGVGRLVDGGDRGDSYNYAPPATDALVDTPESVEVETVAAGPVRGELAVRRTYRWPVGLREDGSARAEETARVVVTTRVELRADEPFVRVRIELENPCRDHRLRFHVPLPRRTEVSAAEGQLAVVERGPSVEGGAGERPVPTFPAQGFVDAGGMAALLPHVFEYELVDGRELALTVLRSTGLISRNDNAWREEPAGPEVPIPDAQLRGPWSVELALHPHERSWADADVLGLLERYRHPFLTAPGSGRDAQRSLGPETGLELEGDGIALSALRRRDGWLELRLACERPRAGTAVVSGGFREAREVDLLGRPLGPLEVESGSLRLELGAWEIRTVQLAR
jgi:alpha-mannosidase